MEPRPAADALDVPERYRASLRLDRRPPTRRSFYLPMRDGVRLAVELWLPPGIDRHKAPAILRQTRYFRAFHAGPWLGRLLSDQRLDPANEATRSLFLASGYAWLDVDVRGSGASFGVQPAPWHPDEVRDGAEIVDWIVRQPWSSGKVGALGVSYDGTAAEMLLVNQHPAVRAVAPRFSLFDVFADVAFPGGLHLSWFTRHWGAVNEALDRNEPQGFVGEVLQLQILGRARKTGARGALGQALAYGVARPDGRALLGRLVGGVLGGVRPVDGEAHLLAEAVASHRDNFNVHTGALRIQCRDQPVQATTRLIPSIDEFSPSTYLAELRGSGAAVLSTSGWYDGAYAGAAIRRHAALGDGAHRLLLGPWSHGGQLAMSPFVDDHETRFDHPAELLRFFDHHLRGLATGHESGPRVRYYTQGAERWREAPSFPPPGVRPRRLWLTQERTLAIGARAGWIEHTPDRRAEAGVRSRWRTLLTPRLHPDASDRAWRSAGLLTFTSEPLPVDTELTGFPALTLRLATTLEDGAFFAYLEDVSPAGGVTLVSEGQLRGLHRRRVEGIRTFRTEQASPLRPGEVEELSFELLPTSYVVPAGHRVRLALACADEAHFTSPPGDPRWSIRVGEAGGSFVDLPVAEG